MRAIACLNERDRQWCEHSLPGLILAVEAGGAEGPLPLLVSEDRLEGLLGSGPRMEGQSGDPARMILLCGGKPKVSRLVALLNSSLTAACYQWPYPAEALGRKLRELSPEERETVAAAAPTGRGNPLEEELRRARGQLEQTQADLNLTYEELQNYVVIVDQLQSLDRKIHTATDIRFILRELIHHAFHLLSCECCLIAFRGKEGGPCRVHTNLERLQAALNADSEALLKTAPFRKVIQLRQACLDNQPSQSHRRFLARFGLRVENLLAVPLVQDERVIGLLAAFNKRGATGFSGTDKFLVKALGESAVTAIVSAGLLRDYKELFLQSAGALAKAIEARDDYTGGHTDRVRTYTLGIAEGMGWDSPLLEKAAIGTTLHDIGKIGIPDSILNKPARLTTEEFALMKGHVTIGVEIIRNVPQLQEIQDYILCHHERWDGNGYPSNLRGEQIPLAGRIVAVADSFDAMTSHRAYRQALPLEQALAELRRCAGTQFDPAVVEVFLDLLARGAFEHELRAPGQG